MIVADSLSIRAGRRWLLRDVSLALRPGEVLALIGPNGAGKSTLLGALAGERRPDAGAVLFDGSPVAALPPLALARRRAVMRQSAALAFPLPASQVVALGRLPWHATPGAAQDEAAVAAAMDAAGITALAAQPYATLSGGERQRVHLARALAQLHGAGRGALLLDEPTASLDMRHAAGLLLRLRRLAAEGLAVLVVLHDLNEAAHVADRVALLAHGQLRALGAPAEVLTPDRLAEVYGLAFRPVPGGGLLPVFDAA